MGPEVIAGQLWVNAKIRELAEGKEPMVQAFEWEDPSERSGRIHPSVVGGISSKAQ